MFQADGTVVTNAVTNTRSSLSGDQCSYRLVLRLVDYEAVVHQTYFRLPLNDGLAPASNAASSDAAFP